MSLSLINVVNAIKGRTVPKEIAPVGVDSINDVNYQVVKLAVGLEGELHFVDSSFSVSSALRPVERTETSADVETTSTLILAANTARRGGWIQNDTTQLMYLSHGSAAEMGKGVRITSGGVHSLSSVSGVYRGAVYGIHAGTGNKKVLVVEET